MNCPDCICGVELVKECNWHGIKDGEFCGVPVGHMEADKPYYKCPKCKKEFDQEDLG